MNKYKTFFYNYWSIIFIMVLTPFLLCLILPILPTHDDWAGTTKPDFNPFFIKEHFLFYGYHWRPFDTWIGYIVGRNPQLLWPAFNHILVVLGHLLCSLAVYRLLATLQFNKTARNVATLFFFITPATMATVTAIDSMNQVYALIFGIVSLLIYVKAKKYQYILWIATIFIATWWKENGLMWALIGPILAYGFDFIDKRKLKKDICIGIGVMAVYALAILLLPKDIIIHPEYEPGPIKIVKNFIKFILSTFITVDYIYLLHKPSRNLFAVCITFVLTFPFIYFIFIRKSNNFLHKKMVCTILCLLIAVGPHIGTIFSMMHTYAGLAMLAIIIAFSIHRYEQHIKPVMLSFIIFCLAAIMIDIHLILSSVESGLVGKKMAQEAIRKTGNPVNSVYVVIIEDDYPKLSSFCVIPNEAFGWGLAARYETNYKWPNMIRDTTITRTPDAIMKAQQLSRQILRDNNLDCVWIVNHKDIEVIKK